jgi:DNA-binding XRE family transcriptional regulator
MLRTTREYRWNKTPRASWSPFPVRVSKMSSGACVAAVVEASRASVQLPFSDRGSAGNFDAAHEFNSPPTDFRPGFLNHLCGRRASFRANLTNGGYNPLVYNHHARHTETLMPRYRQIQPKFGPEKAFGVVLREIREGAGLSQMDVDVQFDIDRTYLSAIERGIQSPTLRMIVRLSRAFKVKPSDMMRRMEACRFYRS